MQRQWRGAAYRFAHQGLLSLFSYGTRYHQPRYGTTNNGLHTPTSITYYLKNALQACMLSAQSSEGILN